VRDLFTEIAADTSPRGVAVGMWARRGFMALFAAIAALALIGLFGQRSSEHGASFRAGTVRLSAPSTVRGGLFFQSRVEVRALRAIDDPRFVLQRGWLEGMQVKGLGTPRRRRTGKHRCAEPPTVRA
jgi:hypothetical protein